jgi:hypothetical protein
MRYGFARRSDAERITAHGTRCTFDYLEQNKPGVVLTYFRVDFVCTDWPESVDGRRENLSYNRPTRMSFGTVCGHRMRQKTAYKVVGRPKSLGRCASWQRVPELVLQPTLLLLVHIVLITYFRRLPCLSLLSLLSVSYCFRESYTPTGPNDQVPMRHPLGFEYLWKLGTVNAHMRTLCIIVDFGRDQLSAECDDETLTGTHFRPAKGTYDKLIVDLNVYIPLTSENLKTSEILRTWGLSCTKCIIINVKRSLITALYKILKIYTRKRKKN